MVGLVLQKDEVENRRPLLDSGEEEKRNYKGNQRRIAWNMEAQLWQVGVDLDLQGIFHQWDFSLSQ